MDMDLERRNEVFGEGKEVELSSSQVALSRVSICAPVPIPFVSGPLNKRLVIT